MSEEQIYKFCIMWGMKSLGITISNLYPATVRQKPAFTQIDLVVRSYKSVPYRILPISLIQLAPVAQYFFCLCWDHNHPNNLQFTIYKLYPYT